MDGLPSRAPALIRQRRVFKDKTARVEHQAVPWTGLINLSTGVGGIFCPERNPPVVLVLAYSRFVNAHRLVFEDLPKCCSGLMQGQLMQGDPSRRRKINLAGGVAGEGVSRLNPLVILNLKPINGNDLIRF